MCPVLILLAGMEMPCEGGGSHLDDKVEAVCGGSRATGGRNLGSEELTEARAHTC